MLGETAQVIVKSNRQEYKHTKGFSSQVELIQIHELVYIFYTEFILFVPSYTFSIKYPQTSYPSSILSALTITVDPNIRLNIFLPNLNNN